MDDELNNHQSTVREQMDVLKEQAGKAQQAYAAILMEISNLQTSCAPHPNRVESVALHDERIVTWRCPDCDEVGSRRR